MFILQAPEGYGQLENEAAVQQLDIASLYTVFSLGQAAAYLLPAVHNNRGRGRPG